MRQKKDDDGETFERLPEEKWRYHVIEFGGTNGIMVDLERALSISSCDAKIGFTLLTRPFPKKIAKHPTLILDPGRLFTLFQGVSERKVSFIHISGGDIENVRHILDRLRSGDPATIPLRRIVQQLLDLEALSQQSPLSYLGYFAVLESLLTHQPKKTDTIDSITRQIIKKVALLDNRWKPRIDYQPFKGAKAETVWSTMYSYRSCLAHGGDPDFKSELQLLESHDTALALLKDAVKRILRQSLWEPQLMADLRNC